MMPPIGDGPGLRRWLRARLSLPLWVAPMFLVSSPAMVIAAAEGGVVGSFPTLNARTPALLSEWFARIRAALGPDALYAPNLILDRRNPRRDEDLAVLCAARPPLVVASVGSPAAVIPQVHGYGGRVFSDVATLRQARKAIAAGADGLILLTAGAGGNTGSLNPFAFAAEVRAIFDGPIGLAGGLTRGRDLRALHAMEVDFGYLGTAFLACTESLAPPEHKRAVAAGGIDDIVQSDRVSGMKANFLRARLEEAGVLEADGQVRDLRSDSLLSWKNVWSAGHGVGSVRGEESLAEVLARIGEEYHAR